MKSIDKSLCLLDAISTQPLASVLGGGGPRKFGNSGRMLRPVLVHATHPPKLSTTTLPVTGSGVVLTLAVGTRYAIPAFSGPWLKADN